MGLEKTTKILTKHIRQDIARPLSLIALSLFFSFMVFPNAIGSIAIVVFILFFLFSLPKWQPLQINKYSYFFISGFFLFQILSLTWSSNIIKGLQEIKVESAFLVITFIFWHFDVINSKKYILFFKAIFTISFLVYFFMWTNYHIEGVSLFQINHLKEKPLNSYQYFNSIRMLLKMKFSYFGYISEWGYYRFGTTPELFVHYTYISFGILIALLFSTQILFKAKKLILKLIYTCISISLVFFLFQLPSKINLVLFFVFLLYLGVGKIQLKYWILVLFALTTFIMIFRAQLLDRLKKIEFIQKEASKEDKNAIIDYQRYQLYSAALQLMKADPILGIGIGDVESKLNKIVIRNTAYEGPIPLNSIILNTHSQFVFSALSTGILGLCLFIIFILYNIYLGLMYRKYELLFLILLFSANSMFENILSRNWGVFLFLIGWIIFICEIRIERKFSKIPNEE